MGLFVHRIGADRPGRFRHIEIRYTWFFRHAGETADKGRFPLVGRAEANGTAVQGNEAAHDGEAKTGAAMTANRIDLVKDRWKFSKKRSSRDPNWTLVATGGAE